MFCKVQKLYRKVKGPAFLHHFIVRQNYFLKISEMPESHMKANTYE